MDDVSTPDAWRKGGETFDFRGRPIFFRRAGQGPTLVCIHGFPSAGWDFYKLWPDLTASYDVVAPDLLGFGWSAKPRDHAYRIEEQADLVSELIAHLKLPASHALVHDYGVSIGQELLARQHDGRGPQWLSMAFLNGGLFPETHRARPIQKLLAGSFGPVIARLMTRRAFERSLRAIFGPQTPPSAAEVDGLWQLLQHDHGQRVVPALIDYMRRQRARRERWVGALLETTVPMCFINGSLDPVSGAHMVQRLRELKPDAKVFALGQLGHYPHMEDAAAVLAAWRDFMKTVGR